LTGLLSLNSMAPRINGRRYARWLCAGGKKAAFVYLHSASEVRYALSACGWHETYFFVIEWVGGD
jgi:hypothetical protein